MGKAQPKEYWYSSLTYTFPQATIIKGDISHLENYLQDWLDRSITILNRASQDGTIQDLAYRYADGDTDLTRTNEYARSEIRAALGTNDAPAYKTRRFFDLINQRVKDTLKLQAQNIWIARLISENPDADDGTIARLFYAEHKRDGRIPSKIPVPTAAYIERIRARLAKNDGELPSISPLFRTPKLQLSRTDKLGSVEFGHDRQTIVFTSPTPDGTVVLSFPVPQDPEFVTGKVCMPDAYVDGHGMIRLQFAIKHKACQSYEPECFLGVDVGVLYPFTAAIVFPDGRRSQTVYPDESIMDKVDLIQNLSYQKARLKVKIDQNARPARAVHTRELAGRQGVELGRIADRIGILKRRVCQDCAHRVVGMALQYHAGIALERLSWSVPSHSFDHALLQDAIVNLALRCGVPVRRVSAAGTSSVCPFDGGRLVQGRAHSSAVTVSVSRPCRVTRAAGSRDPYLWRGASCPVCGRVRDHDGVSPLSIAARACLDRKRACHVSRAVFRLRFRRLSLRAFASVAADDTPVVVAGPSNSDVSGMSLQSGPSVLGSLMVCKNCQDT